MRYKTYEKQKCGGGIIKFMKKVYDLSSLKRVNFNKGDIAYSVLYNEKMIDEDSVKKIIEYGKICSDERVVLMETDMADRLHILFTPEMGYELSDFSMGKEKK